MVQDPRKFSIDAHTPVIDIRPVPTSGEDSALVNIGKTSSVA